MSLLAADVGVRLGSRDIQVNVVAERGQAVALVGPNGAGKTSILRSIAGLQPIDRGHIEFDGVSLDDPSTGVFVPPHRRGFGFVFQDYLLFPHLSVLDNVAFGLTARRTRRSTARLLAAAELDRLGLAELAPLRPHQLSGGQQQRVAMARAVVIRPPLLLLDEPLAAVDAAATPDVRRELRREIRHADRTSILVTHNLVDAFALADRVVVVDDGRIVQQGTLASLTAAPRSRFVAEFVGVNLVEGVVTNGEFQAVSGVRLAVATDHVGPAFARIRPSAVSLHTTRPDGSPRNVLHATVRAMEPRGERMRIDLAPPLGLTAEVTIAAVDQLALRPQSDVWATVKATDIDVYPA